MDHEYELALILVGMIKHSALLEIAITQLANPIKSYRPFFKQREIKKKNIAQFTNV
jgi:hypothetical protein